MKKALRFLFAGMAGVMAFLASSLVIEFVTWWWTSPVDPLTDPALNALRFAASFAMGLGTALLAYPRGGERMPRLAS